MARLLLIGVMCVFVTGCATAQKTDSAIHVGIETSSNERVTLRGVWKVAEFSSRKLGGEWRAFPINDSLYIFTDKHYSYMVVPGVGPRRRYAGDPNRPSDAEKVAAYDSFVAASGTYVLSGSDLALTASLHKNPNEMSGDPLVYRIEMSRDKMVMTISNPPFSPGNERRTTLTRIE